MAIVANAAFDVRHCLFLKDEHLEVSESKTSEESCLGKCCVEPPKLRKRECRAAVGGVPMLLLHSSW